MGQFSKHDGKFFIKTLPREPFDLLDGKPNMVGLVNKGWVKPMTEQGLKVNLFEILLSSTGLDDGGGQWPVRRWEKLFCAIPANPGFAEHYPDASRFPKAEPPATPFLRVRPGKQGLMPLWENYVKMGHEAFMKTGGRFWAYRDFAVARNRFEAATKLGLHGGLSLRAHKPLIMASYQDALGVLLIAYSRDTDKTYVVDHATGQGGILPILGINSYLCRVRGKFQVNPQLVRNVTMTGGILPLESQFDLFVLREMKIKFKLEKV